MFNRCIFMPFRIDLLTHQSGFLFDHSPKLSFLIGQFIELVGAVFHISADDGGLPRDKVKESGIVQLDLFREVMVGEDLVSTGPGDVEGHSQAAGINYSFIHELNRIVTGAIVLENIEVGLVGVILHFIVRLSAPA